MTDRIRKPNRTRAALQGIHNAVAPQRRIHGADDSMPHAHVLLPGVSLPYPLFADGLAEAAVDEFTAARRGTPQPKRSAAEQIRRASESTTFTLVGEWEAVDEHRDWYEPIVCMSLIEGELADRVRAQIGADPDEPVYIIEAATEVGSEYTIEYQNDFIVICGDERKELRSTNDSEGGGIRPLLDWLNGDEYRRWAP